MKRAVFLDRDGVLLFDGGSVHGSCVVPGAKAALDRLKTAGFLLIVVTNQPDIAKGILDPKQVDRVHRALGQVLPLDEILMCPHLDKDDCTCRKPAPGMLLTASRKHDIDLSRSFMVGDRWRDIGAGHAAGATSILIGTGYGELFRVQPDHRAADLDTAVAIMLESA